MKSTRYRNYEKPQWEVEKERIERERREAQERGMRDTEENFPRLGGATAKPVNWSGRKFTELATEWKSEEDERKALEEAEKKGVETPKNEKFILPTFNPSRHYVETEDGEDTPIPAVEETSATQGEDDGWTTIDHSAKFAARRARKQKRMEEKLKRYDEGEEPEPADGEQNEEEQDDSCWNSHLIGSTKKTSDL